jgi:hypothetical protein
MVNVRFPRPLIYGFEIVDVPVVLFAASIAPSIENLHRIQQAPILRGIFRKFSAI